MSSAACGTIVEDVRRDGDAALAGYARRFDGLDGPMEVDRAEIDAGAATRVVRRRAARHPRPRRNIRAVARSSVPRRGASAPSPGVSIEQRVMPLDRVGCYVPGGRYPLPSSLLMTAIPARVAGVREVIAMCPRPDPR